MGYIEGTSRGQNVFWSFEDMVAEDSMVRVIDRFVDYCDLDKLGFTRTHPADTGRNGYAPGPLTKLYVYGYQNTTRSSRKLERECTRNVEVMWLMEGLAPDYKTISEFRRLNIRPLQKLLKEFVKLCRSWELVGENLMAVDGSKFKASNNKKNNFSRKKLEDRLSRIDEKIEEYLTKLDEEDRRDEAGTEAPEGLVKLVERKELYEAYLEQLNRTGENELSTVDPDARLMGNNRGGVEMAYNVQSVVDAKNHLIVDFDVSMNPSDQGQFGNMAKRLIRQGYRRFTLLADKGYYNGKCLQKGKKYKIIAIVSRQKSPDLKGQPKQFHTNQFQYDRETDTYTCPAGETLHPHNKETAKRRNFFNKTACGKCPHLSHCTSGKTGYRTIVRGEYADIYEEADRVFNENKDLYKLRQQLVEHPFGTVKRTMDGGYYLLRRRRKVRCETALLFLGYNLKRAYNVLGFKEIMARLDSLSSPFYCFLCVFSRFLRLSRCFC
ncbi:MAG: IS1182 family transposase [Peptococcaceae bacterium]|nr:IS1182 family transposase [Peptococcaceae bacterium]